MFVVGDAKSIENQQKAVAPPAIRREDLLTWAERVFFLSRNREISVGALTIPPAEVSSTLLSQFPFSGCNLLLFLNQNLPFQLALRFDELPLDVCETFRLLLILNQLIYIRLVILFVIILLFV